DRIIQRFIPLNNISKQNIYSQVYEFISLVTSFMDFQKNINTAEIIEKYNTVIELLSSSSDLMYCLIDLTTFIGNFSSNFIIKKYLYVLNEIVENINNGESNYDIIMVFGKYVCDNELINNFINLM